MKPPLHDRKMDALRTILGRGDRPRIVVETGTLHGELSVRLPELFEVVHTIELSMALYVKLPTNDKRVNWHFGDSRHVLRELLTTLSEPCLFFLDAHFFESRDKKVSHGVVGESDLPLWDELDIIAQRHYADIVVVDDCHCFGEEKGERYGDWQNVNPESLVARLGRVSHWEATGDMFSMWRPPTLPLGEIR